MTILNLKLLIWYIISPFKCRLRRNNARVQMSSHVCREMHRKTFWLQRWLLQKEWLYREHKYKAQRSVRGMYPSQKILAWLYCLHQCVILDFFKIYNVGNIGVKGLQRVHSAERLPIVGDLTLDLCHSNLKLSYLSYLAKYSVKDI